MLEIFIANHTGKTLFVTGSKGSDWAEVSRNAIAPGGSGKIGRLKLPASGESDHWGWIFLGTHSSRHSNLQAYVWAGHTEGLKDYSIQYYDGGECTDDDTIDGTNADYRNGAVWFTIGDVFETWTKDLPDDLKLHQVTLPGTHDSATHELWFPSKCQNVTIAEQLHMGVRYFDIRMNATSDGFRIIHGSLHGSGDTNYWLRDVAQEFYDFLTGRRDPNATEETIVLQMKFDRNEIPGRHPLVMDIVEDVFRDDRERLFDQAIKFAGPTLGDLRGKLVLLRRYDRAASDGKGPCTPVKDFIKEADFREWRATGATRNWPTVFAREKFEWPDGANDPDGYRNEDKMAFVIQDKYKASPEEKAGLVIQYLEAAASNARPDAWYLNFASAAPSSGIGPGKAAEHVNPLLKARLEQKGKGRYGTILMDFVTRDLVKTVAEANF